MSPFDHLMAATLAFALGLILFIHFMLFAFYGSVIIYERNRYMLGFELAMSIAIMVFGVYYWLKYKPRLKR